MTARTKMLFISAHSRYRPIPMLFCIPMTTVLSTIIIELHDHHIWATYDDPSAIWIVQGRLGQ